MTREPDIPTVRTPKTPANQSAGALAEQLQPLYEAFAAFLPTITRIAEYWQQVSAQLSNIDWSGGLERLEASQSALAEAGWTLVDWIDLEDLTMLSRKTPKELDKYFTNGFMANDAQHLSFLQQHLVKCPMLVQWYGLIDEIFVSIKAGRHRIAIPATLTIIEGRLASFLITHSAMNPQNPNPFKALERQGWHKAGYDAFFWKSSIIFLEKVFGDRRFDQDQPSFISRHWILHGRSAIDWTLADSLRLVNALASLDFLFEKVGPSTA